MAGTGQRLREDQEVKASSSGERAPEVDLDFPKGRAIEQWTLSPKVPLLLATVT